MTQTYSTTGQALLSQVTAQGYAETLNHLLSHSYSKVFHLFGCHLSMLLQNVETLVRHSRVTRWSQQWRHHSNKCPSVIRHRQTSTHINNKPVCDIHGHWLLSHICMYTDHHDCISLGQVSLEAVFAPLSCSTSYMLLLYSAWQRSCMVTSASLQALTACSGTWLQADKP